ncbi:TetR/AcrR family transcriptional regulator [Rhodococcus spelaei]|uniref:TetR/AcrR family transcriptional regulator n=1 Tax=Rhodococcus spelaei TaxID=2546320 RepID=UPI0015EE59DE|nr:TetR/AcrR family transcriptional regulator [Rhodococcus spelaei]
MIPVHPDVESNAEAALGRRERGKTQKQARIFRAAADLFDERGYGAVTTQQIADRADVSIGTLFRYASTKAELLLMVYNEAFAAAVAEGEAAARFVDDPVDRVIALVTPVLEVGRVASENTVAYQRDLLFGPADEPFRSKGLAIVVRLESLIAGGLDRHADTDVTHSPAMAAARAVFAAVHMEIAHPLASVPASSSPSDSFLEQVALIVTGYLTRHPSGPNS